MRLGSQLPEGMNTEGRFKYIYIIVGKTLRGSRQRIYSQIRESAQKGTGRKRPRREGNTLSDDFWGPMVYQLPLPRPPLQQTAFLKAGELLKSSKNYHRTHESLLRRSPPLVTSCASEHILSFSHCVPFDCAPTQRDGAWLSTLICAGTRHR